ncbi:MBL fold metallo-hydrolase, partial [Nostoc sp. NIES-2111]
MITLSRRAFALSLPTATLAGSAIATASSWAQATEVAGSPVRAQQLPPAAQFRIGRFTITALTDGYADMPFTYFPGHPAAETEEQAKVASSAKPGGIRFMFNQYLIDDGERLILIDTGPAGSLGQSGRLPAALQAIGVRPQDIGAIIITHTHQDHIGGLVAGGRCNYPDSEIYVDRRDVTYWTDPAKKAVAPDYIQNSFALTADMV